MKTLNLIQGTPEWHAHRLTHFNASDAPAMMGCSPYETRTQLIHRLKTGIAPEVDAGTQRRFDDGHRFEALARPLAEEIIGDDLYPVTGSEGELSASFDGLTMDESDGFEHKSLNAELRTAMVPGGTGAALPPAYRIQMEQQCMVSRCDRVLFMASKWDVNQETGEWELVEERHCWYTPDLDLRAQIVAGWKQLAIDRDAYVAAAPVVEAIGRTPETLPALHIEVTGQVTASNLFEYKEHALAVFKGINRELTTDQQFADAEKTVKWCADVEERLAAAKQHALSQTASIDDLFRTIDDISAEARRTRLELTNLVKAQKESRRTEIVMGGSNALAEYVKALNVRLGKPYMPTITGDFAGAIKGKKNLDSMENAVATELARVKIEASAIADRIQVNLQLLQTRANLAFLFPDVQQIVIKAPEDFAALAAMRIVDHEKKEATRLEAERDRIRGEEQVKAQREAAEKAAAELRAQAKKEATRLEAERDRIRGEEQVKAQREAAEKAAAELRAQAVAEPKEDPHPQSLTAGQQAIIDAIPVADAHSNVIRMNETLPLIPMTAPTLKLGTIAERLGFAVTANFLRTLGFEAAVKQGVSTLFHEADFTHICAALVKHINQVQAKQAA